MRPFTAGSTVAGACARVQRGTVPDELAVALGDHECGFLVVVWTGRLLGELGGGQVSDARQQQNAKKAASAPAR
jgi:hypothetical protein